MSIHLRKYAILFFFLCGLFDAPAMVAQQSSSSTAQASTPAAPKTVPLSKWFVEGAGGISFGPGLANGQVINSTYTGTGGGGFRLTRRLEIPGELSFYRSGLPSWVLQTAQQHGGHYTILTYSVDPTFYFLRGERYGFFAVGGGGYSHIATTFDQPIGSTINCNIYSGLGYTNFTNYCNGTITGSSYSSNQGMYNFGIGMEGRLYPNHRAILFAQGRYIKMMTPANQLPGPNFALVSITTGIRW
ncbi:MAG TPA: hypothetical protein VND66_04890 [Acidobacteriaceae bacterium]|nr:hypothetical protein [Terriglobia bacterium]HVC89944.1 hypothetical protein [Acidobacteriaceae bacterium]